MFIDSLLANKVNFHRTVCEEKRCRMKTSIILVLRQAGWQVKSATENISRVSVICYLNRYLCYMLIEMLG